MGSAGTPAGINGHMHDGTRGSGHDAGSAAAHGGGVRHPNMANSAESPVVNARHANLPVPVRGGGGGGGCGLCGTGQQSAPAHLPSVLKKPRTGQVAGITRSYRHGGSQSQVQAQARVGGHLLPARPGLERGVLRFGGAVALGSASGGAPARGTKRPRVGGPRGAAGSGGGSASQARRNTRDKQARKEVDELYRISAGIFN